MGEWDEQLFAVFDDLEQQADAMFDAEREAELADRSRAEYAAVTLVSRLMAGLDGPVTLEVVGVGHLDGTLVRVAKEWLMLTAAASDWVVPVEAVSGAELATDRAVPEVAWSPISRRLGLRSALRRLSEAGERCVVHGRDGGRVEGRLLRVGHDFVEVEIVPGRVRLLAFSALAGVQAWD